MRNIQVLLTVSDFIGIHVSYAFISNLYRFILIPWKKSLQVFKNRHLIVFIAKMFHYCNLNINNWCELFVILFTKCGIQLINVQFSPFPLRKFCKNSRDINFLQTIDYKMPVYKWLKLFCYHFCSCIHKYLSFSIVENLTNRRKGAKTRAIRDEKNEKSTWLIAKHFVTITYLIGNSETLLLL